METPNPFSITLGGDEPIRDYITRIENSCQDRMFTSPMFRRPVMPSYHMLYGLPNRTPWRELKIKYRHILDNYWFPGRGPRDLDPRELTQELIRTERAFQEQETDHQYPAHITRREGEDIYAYGHRVIASCEAWASISPEHGHLNHPFIECYLLLFGLPHRHPWIGLKNQYEEIMGDSWDPSHQFHLLPLEHLRDLTDLESTYRRSSEAARQAAPFGPIDVSDDDSDSGEDLAMLSEDDPEEDPAEDPEEAEPEDDPEGDLDIDPEEEDPEEDPDEEFEADPMQENGGDAGGAEEEFDVEQALHNIEEQFGLEQAIHDINEQYGGHGNVGAANPPAEIEPAENPTTMNDSGPDDFDSEDDD